jgi:hypothetical protein
MNSVENSMTSYCWEHKYRDIKFWFVDVISRRPFVVLLCIFFLEFGDNERPNFCYDFLYGQKFERIEDYLQQVVGECWNEVWMKINPDL